MNPSAASQIPPIPAGLTGDALIAAINDKIRRVASLGAGFADLTSNASLASPADFGLATAFSKLVASVTSGISYDAQGNIKVVPGTNGIVVDGSGNVTVQPNVRLSVNAQGFLTTTPTPGIAGTSGQIVVPGGTATAGLIAALQASQLRIQNKAIGTLQIADASIGTLQCQNLFVTNALIGIAAIGTANIQTAAITDALIVSLVASKITAGSLVAGVVYTGTIFATQVGSGTFPVGVVYAGTILATQIGSGTLPVGVIYAGTINATQVNAGTLSAVNVSAGTLVLNLNGITTQIANAIAGSYFSGLSVKDNSTSGSIQLVAVGGSGAGLRILNPAGVQIVSIPPGQSQGGISLANSAGTSWCDLDGSFGGGLGRINLLTGAELDIAGTTVIDSSRNGTFAALTRNGLTVLNTAGSAVKMACGRATFNGSGLKVVATGLTTVVSAVANVIGTTWGTEFVTPQTPAGGSVSFWSNNAGSGADFFWQAFGT